MMEPNKQKIWKCERCGDVCILQENETVVKCMCDYEKKVVA